MPTTLSDAKGSVDRFIKEARCCAMCEHGFAAMLTAFSVLLAVQEAVNGSRASDADLIAGFVPHMMAKTSWFHKPVVPASDNDIARALGELRNALAHQLSMPEAVKLANDTSELAVVRGQWPQADILSVLEFVDDVLVTANSLIAAHPTKAMDPDPPKSATMPRDIAERKTFPDGTSASSAR